MIRITSKFRKLPMYFLSLVLIFLISDPVQAQESPPARESVPTFAIFPFHSPHDPDYGVFMAELMYHRDVPAWQGRRFELERRRERPTHARRAGSLGARR